MRLEMSHNALINESDRKNSHVLTRDVPVKIFSHVFTRLDLVNTYSITIMCEEDRTHE